MKKNKLYRGEFEICVCEDSELNFILWQFETAKEFSDFIGVKENVGNQTLHHLFNKKTSHLKLNGSLYLVEFIKVDEN